MKNHKIVFANQKGGVGKSTLCMLFANYLASKNKPVSPSSPPLRQENKVQNPKCKPSYKAMARTSLKQNYQ